jgi:excisionase family DNA binding protein
MPTTRISEFMRVRDVARYLGINEKKVYFLAKARKIPCTRVTGKWLFPKKLIDRWIEESASGSAVKPRSAAERPFLLAAGSDDPALAIINDLYAARSTAALFIATVGSGGGLASIRAGVADFATAHLLDPDRCGARGRGGQALLPADTVVVELFYRQLGWLVPKGNPKGIKSVRDLSRTGLRFINRQAGSGTRLFFDQQLAAARLTGKRISGYDDAVSTHLEVGVRILSGRCDAGLATRTTAQLLGLDFVPLTRERFDMIVPKDRFFTPGMQNLLALVGSREFRDRVEALGGYDVAESGRIVGSN